MSFSEKVSGTNAIALSIKLGKSVYILPENHYCSFLKKWFCYAVPIRVNERLVGCIAMSTSEQPVKKELIAVSELLKYQIVNEFKKKRKKLFCKEAGV